MNENRIVIVRLHPSLLSRMFAGHPMSALTSDWPEDAEVVDIQMDRDRFASVVMKVTSSAFDEVGEACLIPEWSPTFTYTRPDDVLQSFIDKVRERT
jgi:hypothetical protein